MGEGWEILLSGVKSRDRPTFRKQEPPVDMNTDPNVGDLSYSALLSLACGRIQGNTFSFIRLSGSGFEAYDT